MHTKAHTFMIQICIQKSTYKHASQGSVVNKLVGYVVRGPKIIASGKISPSPYSKGDRAVGT